MKTVRNLLGTLMFLGISFIGFAGNTINSFGDDTIRVVLSNSSEIKIIVDDNTDLDKLKSEIKIALNNISNEVDQIALDERNIDTIIVVDADNMDIMYIGLDEDDDSYGEDYDSYIAYDEYEDYDYGYDDDYSYDDNYFDFWDNDSYNYKSHRLLRHSAYFDIGLNNYLENGIFPGDNGSQYSVKPFGSWNVAFGGILSVRVARPFSLDFGYGFSWYNFKYQDKATVVEKGQTSVEFSKRLRDGNYILSKTSIPYFDLSFTPMFHTSHFNFGVGAYAGYRLGGKVKYKYEIDGEKYKIKHRGDYFLSSYKYGVKVVIGFKNDIELYATYDFSTLYAKDRGPELNPIAFGIRFKIS